MERGKVYFSLRIHEYKNGKKKTDAEKFSKRETVLST